MKKKMSLVKLSKNSLKQVKAGALPTCSCQCWFDGYGGSSIAANNSANTAGGLHSCTCTGCSGSYENRDSLGQSNSVA
jgi:hypothetical protein